MDVFQQIWSFLLSLFGVVTQPQAPVFDYIYPTFSVQEIGDCADGSRVWVYTPDTSKPSSSSSSSNDVVVYLHGYAAAFPLIYQQHIEHIVKQGHTVLFPQFQEGFCFDNFSLEGASLAAQSPADWAERAVLTVTDAIENVVVEYDKVYLYGHSLGGAIGLMWGALSSGDLLVDIAAGVLASPQPGGFEAIPVFVTTFLPFFFGEDIDVVAAARSTQFPVVVLHGNDDTTAPLSDLLPSYNALGSTEKAIYQATSDKHGAFDINADHVAATSISFLGDLDVNTLDWRYYWSALDQVMQGVPVTQLDFNLGEWSDGVPVECVVRVD